MNITVRKLSCEFYVNEFQIRKWERIINRIIFDGSLPPFRNVILRQSKTVWGICWSSGLKRKKYADLQICRYFPTFWLFLEILAHEMVHHYQYWYECPEITIHGNTFRSWKKIFHKHGLDLKISVSMRRSKTCPFKMKKSLERNLKKKI